MFPCVEIPRFKMLIMDALGINFRFYEIDDDLLSTDTVVYSISS